MGLSVILDKEYYDNYIIDNNIVPNNLELLDELDCDGTFFFDLGFNLFKGIIFDLNIRPIKPKESYDKKTRYWRGVIGVYNDMGNNDNGFAIYTTNYMESPWCFALNNFGYSNPSLYKITSYNPYQIKTDLTDILINDTSCENDTCQCNDKFITLDVNNYYRTNNTVYLLSVNGERSANPFIGKFSSLFVYNEEGECLHKYVPCKSKKVYYTVKEHKDELGNIINEYYISKYDYSTMPSVDKNKISEYIDTTPIRNDVIYDLVEQKIIEKTYISSLNQSVVNNSRYLTFDNLTYNDKTGKLIVDIYNYNDIDCSFMYGITDLNENILYGNKLETFKANTYTTREFDLVNFKNQKYKLVPTCQLLGDSNINSTMSITDAPSYNLYWDVEKRVVMNPNDKRYIISVIKEQPQYEETIIYDNNDTNSNDCDCMNSCECGININEGLNI